MRRRSRPSTSTSILRGQSSSQREPSLRREPPTFRHRPMRSWRPRPSPTRPPLRSAGLRLRGRTQRSPTPTPFGWNRVTVVLTARSPSTQSSPSQAQSTRLRCCSLEAPLSSTSRTMARRLRCPVRRPGESGTTTPPGHPVSGKSRRKVEPTSRFSPEP